MRADQSHEKYVMALMRVIREAPSVAEGCRMVGIHRSTYYRWRKKLAREVSLVGAGRRVSAERVRLEAEVVALALANPPWGPEMLFHWLVRAGVRVGSSTQVWRILRTHGLNTAYRRFELMRLAIGLEAPAELVLPSQTHRPPMGRLEAEIPGDLVQMDCFHIGKIRGAKIAGYGQGTVWQYTAIDVASSYVWAEIHTSRHNPDPVRTTALAHRVATELAGWGWELTAITTDNGNEFKADLFADSVTAAGIDHRRITPGRPQTNGKSNKSKTPSSASSGTPPWLDTPNPPSPDYAKASPTTSPGTTPSDPTTEDGTTGNHPPTSSNPTQETNHEPSHPSRNATPPTGEANAHSVGPPPLPDGGRASGGGSKRASHQSSVLPSPLALLERLLRVGQAGKNRGS